MLFPTTGVIRMNGTENKISLDDVREKYLRKNQLLFSRDSACLRDLIRLICAQKHRTIVMWAFTCVAESVTVLRHAYPEDPRPEEAVRICKLWAEGKVKMPVAKKALLSVHAMARDVDNPRDCALCHAVGQACAAVHVETHAVGLVCYELTAIVRELGIEKCEDAVDEKINFYLSTLQIWQERIDSQTYSWADFLLDDSRVNKELLLWKKRSKSP